jgi:hypothetical protein
MAVLEILHHPDPRLRLKARTVENYGRDLQRLIDDMFETMYAEPGIGLAATQVGVALRIAIMDLSPDQSDQRVLINPEILATDELQEMEEGCLTTATWSSAITGCGCAPSISRANRLRSTPKACSRSACNTRSTISTASCISTICLRSNASA